ncbi:MAG TPA: hypothetical protein VM840_02340 [Actinomycetota bacterium]|nr:hypothetical protein [Actinomycetota bacterium]
MGRRRSNRLEVTIAAGTGQAMVTPVPTSRIKMMATILGITLAIAPAPWAFKTYDSSRADNGTKPVGTHERIEVLPGVAQMVRDNLPQQAATADPAGRVSLDLGEIPAGTSTSFVDLFRIRNGGSSPVLVFVEPEALATGGYHVSVSGDRAPGAFWLEPGDIRAVDMGFAADLVSTPGDGSGDVVVRTASNLVRRSVPARWTVTPASEDAILAALLAAAGISNPEGGFGKLGDAATGLEKPDFELGGVWDGGIYTGTVSLSWRPVGPLTDARATLNGRAIGRSTKVDREGDHLLRLEALIMGSVKFEREVRFRIDNTAPSAVLFAPAISFGNPARFSVKTEDSSPVAGVDVLVLRRTDEPQSSPSPSPSPSPTPRPTSSPTPSPTPKASSTPAPSATPAPSSTPQPSSSPAPSPTPAQSAAPQVSKPGPEPIRVTARYDQESGMWVADVNLEPGTYDVWAEAVDVVGNRSTTHPQRIEVLKPLVPSLR